MLKKFCGFLNILDMYMKKCKKRFKLVQISYLIGKDKKDKMGFLCDERYVPK